jgi:hypothetical protein
VVNPGFDSDTGWTKLGEAEINGGTGRILSTVGVFAGLRQNVLVSGTTYTVEFDIVSEAVPGLGLSVANGGGGLAVENITGVGRKSVIFTSIGPELVIGRQGGATDIRIDNVVVIADPVLGPELVTNGGFDTGDFTGWDLHSTGTSIVSNACQIDYNAGFHVNLGQDLAVILGETYSISYEVVSMTGITPGEFVLGADSSFGAFGIPTSVGRHNLILPATNPSPIHELYLRLSGSLSDPGDTITIDNVSVRKVLSPWNPGDGWDISGGNAAYTSDGTDTTLEQSTIALVDGRTYKVFVDVSNVALADPSAYYGIQLGGGTIFSLTQAHTYDESDPLYLECGSTPTDGLQISSSAFTTAGDTVTLDDISVIVEQFKTSTNLGSVFVTGDADFRVPAGIQILANNDFSAWTGSSPDATPDGWDYVGDVRVDSSNELLDGAGMEVISDGNITLTIEQTGVLTVGKEYLVTAIIGAYVGGVVEVLNGTDTILSCDDDDTFTDTFVATSIDLLISSVGSMADLTVTSVTLFELTNGPIDEYVRDMTDFGDPLGPGYYNSEFVYISVDEHADGAGSNADWYVRSRQSNDKWYLTTTSPETADVPSGSRWVQVTGLIGDYNPVFLPAIGTATVTFGPTDHSQSSSSAGLETDGVAGFIDLKTSFDFLNDMRDGKFGIVSVFEVDSDAQNSARILSGETALNTGYRSVRGTSANIYQERWSGTAEYSNLTQTVSEDNLHNTITTFDIGSTNAWFSIDGEFKQEDSDVSGLDPSMSVKFRLGAAAHTEALHAKAKFGFTSILDFTNVTTVDESWSTELSEAINTAALSSNYNAHSIAASIFNYDNNISGVYYALNELSSGDASNCYLLAYDIATQTAITQGVYGLTSTSGVTGTQLVPGGNSIYGPKKSILGPVRSIYTGNKNSIYGPFRSILSN